MSDKMQLPNPNFYIRGTTSHIFYVLQKNDFELVSMLNMLLKKIAPLCGEIEYGNYVNCLDVGEASFGSVFINHYSASR